MFFDFMRHTPHPDLPPPVNSSGIRGWLRNNLFSSPLNTLFTLGGLYFLYWFIPPLLQWTFFQADWTGTNRDACTSDGACWVFVRVRFYQFMYGFYPQEESWRVNLAFFLLPLLLLPLWIKNFKHKLSWALGLLTVYPLIAYTLLMGGWFGLSLIESERWGGLMLTLIIAAVGITAALPGGILLALGRRSKMPLVKAFSVAFIELWRGVPLITVLFMASVMLPLFLPEGANFDKLLRALIGIVLFQSAYMAEVVRGGLQAIPKGQYEAAKSLGLGYWKSTFLIILPQALKLVIPGIVNTFIALFKDTTLVLIIGLLDLLAIVQSALADPHWLGYSVEGYVFVASIFWIFCFAMSRYSRYLEVKLHTGHKVEGI